MDVIPTVRSTRFEQLQPGDLFMYLDGRESFYALKTQPPAKDHQSMMVLLGPTFIQGEQESTLLGWQGVTVLSVGKNFTVFPSLDPAAWNPTGPNRTSVWLAVSDENTYVCTNGSSSPRMFHPYFVEMKTGAIVERQLPGSPVFTNAWEIAVTGAGHPPRTVLKYPLPRAAAP